MGILGKMFGRGKQKEESEQPAEPPEEKNEEGQKYNRLKTFARQLLKTKDLETVYSILSRDVGAKIADEILMELEEEMKTPEKTQEEKIEPSAPFFKRMRGTVIRNVYAWIPAVIGIILFVWLGTSTGNTLVLSGGVLFSLSLAVPKGASLGAFKAIIKFVGILLLSWGFLSIYPFAGLIALFLGYISMPVKVRVKEEEQTYNNAVGFSRMILGIMLAIFILNVLGGDNSLKIPMFLIALGFFFAIPEASEDIPKGAGVTIINYLGKKGDSAAALSGLLILAGVGLGALQLTLWSATWIIFVSVGLVGAFTAFRSHAAERGTMGAPIVALLLITLSTSYPALLGESIFGAWWPSVESSITSITAPLGDAWGQASSGMGSAFSMVTNPTAYWEQEQARQQLAANVKSGGTAKSIEVTESEITINNVPQQPLVGTATLENRGEFTANSVNIVLNPPKTKSKDRGVLTPMDKDSVIYKFKTCSGGTKGDSDKSCSWTLPSYSGDLKQVVFVYGEDEKDGSGVITKSGWGSEIGNCVCYNSDKTKKGTCLVPTNATKKTADPTGCKKCENVDLTTTEKAEDLVTTKTYSCDLGSGEIIGYESAGKTLVVGFKYSFEYIVNVSLDLQMMQSETLDDMLLKKQIKLQSVKADYSGGPVKAAISTLKQPVRAGEDTFATISIENSGTGALKSNWMDGTNTHYTKYILKMPFINGKDGVKPILTSLSGSGLDCGEIKNDAATGTGTDNPDFTGRITNTNTDGYELHCLLKNNGEYRDLQKGESAKYSFMFKYDIPKGVDRKTALFVGNVNYRYENSKDLTTQITWAPPQ